MEGGEKEDRGESMSKSKRRAKRKKEPNLRDLFIIILGFVSAAFGFLLLITPSNYPIGDIPITYNPLIGITLIALGLHLLLRSD